MRKKTVFSKSFGLWPKLLEKTSKVPPGQNSPPAGWKKTSLVPDFLASGQKIRNKKGKSTRLPQMKHVLRIIKHLVLATIRQGKKWHCFPKMFASGEHFWKSKKKRTLVPISLDKTAILVYNML